MTTSKSPAAAAIRSSIRRALQSDDQQPAPHHRPAGGHQRRDHGARPAGGRTRRPVEPHEVRPSRVMIAIHVDPEVRDQLRAIAYEQKVPLRGLVCAGLNAVFAQHHKPEIAR